MNLAGDPRHARAGEQRAVIGDPQEGWSRETAEAGGALPEEWVRRRDDTESKLQSQQKTEQSGPSAHRFTLKRAVNILGNRARATEAITHIAAMSHSPRLTPFPMTPWRKQ